MIQCPVCRVSYVTNTLFCGECGLYLLEDGQLGTDPLEAEQVRWIADADHPSNGDIDLPDTGPLIVRLSIHKHNPRGENGRGREVKLALIKPVRLGRIDPSEDTYPEVDLTADLAMEQGVSREHACIFRRGNSVEVEDLGSTNGTLLNGNRLAPYIPTHLQDGDELRLGKLLIKVSIESLRTRDMSNGKEITHQLSS